MAYIRKFCPAYQFQPRVRVANPKRLSTSAYRIHPPRNVKTIPDPLYVDVTAMNKLLRNGIVGRSASLSITSGLVVPKFSVEFSDFKRQWKCVSGSGQNAQWQFQGGKVYFQVELSLYILKLYRPVSGDSCSLRMFEVVMDHELEHISDEIDIVTNWLPPRAYRDRLVKRYFSEAQPLVDKTFRHWFKSPAFTDWIKSGLWVKEHNRRAGFRDAPAQYQRVQNQINTLQALQTNNGKCP